MWNVAKRILTAVAVIGAAAVPSTAYSSGPAQTAVVRPIPVAPRPLISAPAPLVSEASEPCVLYTCAAHPQLHINWENTLGTLPDSYCRQYKCSPMDLIPDHGFDDNLFPFDPDWAYTNECRATPSSCPAGSIPDANKLCNEFHAPGESTFKGNPIPPGEASASGYLGSPPCTRQSLTLDGPGSVGGLGFFGGLIPSSAVFACPEGREPAASFHGHVNWEPATYEGTLEWEAHSKPGTDDDYSLNLLTDGGAGATQSDPTGLHIEFDSDETIDHFDSNQWWKEFHSLVDIQDATGHDDPGLAINGHRAVVTGLAGLDTAHDPALELHPVYALAIQTDRRAAVAGGTDKWAVFARSWGNEGYCSHKTHPLPPGPLTIRIPWQNGATGLLAGVEANPALGVQITKYDLNTDISPYGKLSARVVPGQGVLLTFDLSAPVSQEPRYSGTVDLKWTFGPPPILGAPGTPEPLRNSPAVSVPRSTAPSDDGESSDVEALVARLWRRLPRAIRLKALAEIPNPFFRRATRPVRTLLAEPPTSPLRPFAAFVAPSSNALIIAQGTAERRALCAAYRNRVPGYPTMCRSVHRK
jgi:hypothetical protein